jgi:hypothetical protein
MGSQNDLFNQAADPAESYTDALGIIHDGAPIVVCYGGGVDSTAMLIAMKHEGIIPDLIMFADTGGEKESTYAFVKYIDAWLTSWGAPTVTWVKRKPSPRVSYTTLEGNCLDNETLPSLAFGMHSCSLKWKVDPQDQFLKGVSRGPNKRHGWQPALEAWAAGLKPIKLIGYDNGPADIRRRKRAMTEDDHFRYHFPLQVLEWGRKECIQAIVEEGLNVPVKSACFFCPASKPWELFHLASEDPEQLMRSLKIERNALEGRHSRWDEVKFGASWWDFIKDSKRFPSEAQAGLGRRFSWNQWAVENGIVNLDGEFIGDREACLRKAKELRGDDNALDRRAA